MITSVMNPQVKQVCGYVQRARERRRDRIYVVEGPGCLRRPLLILCGGFM